MPDAAGVAESTFAYRRLDPRDVEAHATRRFSTTAVTAFLSEPLAIAAADTAHVRAPSEGTLVASRKRPAIEAVLFEDPDARRLALYAHTPALVRLVAEGVTTEATLQGYWLGRVDSAATSLKAVLHLGKRRAPWALALQPARRRRRKKRK